VGVIAGQKLSGITTLGPNGKPVCSASGRPDVVHDKESSLLSITLDNSYITPQSNKYLIWLDNMPSTGVSFRFGKFAVGNEMSKLPAGGLQINWSLYASGGVIIDTEPVWQGTTWLDLKSNVAREGLLVQITGLDASAWFLRATLPNQSPTDQIFLSGAFEYFCPVTPLTSVVNIVTGPYLG
jgi:hypothetical protein